jgi:hypothetical protein
MGPGQARGAWLLLDIIDSPIWDAKLNHIKNREENGASALGGHCLSATRNNQLGFGGHGRRDAEEEACGGWSMWDGGVQLFEATNSAQKSII